MHDLSKCLIDISLCPKGENLIDYFIELSSFQEFKDATNDEISIAILTSDTDSPFLKTKDRDAMLRSIFNYLNLKIEDNKEFFDQVFQYKHNKVTGCWARYLNMQHDIDFTEWLMTKQTYDFLMFEANRPKGDKEGEEESYDKYLARRIKVQSELKKIGDQLKQIEIKIFPESKLARVIAMSESKKIKTYPEMYAQDRRVV